MGFLSKAVKSIGKVISSPVKVFGNVLGMNDSHKGTDAADRDYQNSLNSAKTQMEFQQYNSDTSYQRAVKDLQAAGLNPLLAALNGGASTPSGASSASDFVGGENSNISRDQLQNQRVQTWLSAANGMANFKNTNANTAFQQQQTELMKSQLTEQQFKNILLKQEIEKGAGSASGFSFINDFLDGLGLGGNGEFRIPGSSCNGGSANSSGSSIGKAVADFWDSSKENGKFSISKGIKNLWSGFKNNFSW